MDFILRPWKIDDLDNLVKYANDIEIANNMTDGFPYPYTEQNGKDFIGFAMKDIPSKILAIQINKEAVGGIGVHPQSGIQRKNAELGYWLARKYWGKGIISKAIPQMVDYGFTNFDINRILK